MFLTKTIVLGSIECPVDSLPEESPAKRERCTDLH